MRYTQSVLRLIPNESFAQALNEVSAEWSANALITDYEEEETSNESNHGFDASSDSDSVPNDKVIISCEWFTTLRLHWRTTGQVTHRG